MAWPAPLRRRSLQGLLAVGLTVLAAEAALRVAGGVYLRRLYGANAAVAAGGAHVVCLGESSTAGLWVDFRDAYPQQLERSLRALYRDDRIRVVVPPHVGQNTSQMANRIGEYLELYRPRLVIVMAGVNNEWSLAESHIVRYLPAADPRALEIRLLTVLDSLRLFKLVRWAWLRVAVGEGSDHVRQNTRYVWGHPELVRYPPEGWTYGFARDHRDAFVALWRSDVRAIAEACRARGVRVALMTYPIDPGYLPAGEFVALAQTLDVPLVRNDLAFAPLLRDGRIHRYVFRDHWHPNARGYGLVAGNALRAVAEGDLLGLGRREGAGGGAPGAEATSLPPPLPAGVRLDVGSEAAEAYLGDGWSLPEGDFRWTDGPQAEIVFGRPASGASSLRLRFRAFLVTGRLQAQRVRFTLNGRAVGSQRVSRLEAVELVFPLQDVALGDRNVFRLELPDARAPASLDAGRDPRPLGIAVEWLRLD